MVVDLLGRDVRTKLEIIKVIQKPVKRCVKNVEWVGMDVHVKFGDSRSSHSR